MPTGGRERGGVVRWRLARVVVALTVAGASLLVLAGPAAAADGLDVATDSTFAFEPTEARVRVTVEATVRNSKADERTGTTVRRFFYRSLVLPVPVGAAEVVATSDGASLPVTVEPASARVARATITFPSDLFSGQDRRVTLRYALAGEVPRSEAFVRVNRAYASFVAYGAGDPGRVTVTVTAPAGFDVETLGNEMTRTSEGERVVLRSGPIADPDRWYVGVSARDDAFLTRRDLEVAGHPMRVSSWPGDADWAAFVERDLTSGVPALERLVGLPWPVDDRLEIVETITPYLRGYAGWFIAAEATIEVGEDLDDRTLLHELSHAWFNRQLFTSRWVNEGLAEEYSARALAALGRPAPAPAPIDDASPHAVPLESWSAPSRRDTADDSEAWGYGASWSVVHDLVDEIGTERMAAVLRAAHDGTPAYATGAGGSTARAASSASPASSASGASGASARSGAGWQRLLDLLQETGGSTRAEALFHQRVVPADRLPVLEVRRVARAAAADLAAAGAGWAVPAGVASALEAWDFDRATALVGGATDVLERRDALAAEAAAAGLAPASSRVAYEAATVDVAPVRDAIERRRASVRAIVAARAAVAEPQSLVERVGLVGNEPRAALDAAARAFALDDTAGADAAAARAVAFVTAAGGLGRQRVVTVAVIAGSGLLLAAIGLVWALRARHRRREREEAEDEAVGRALVASGMRPPQPSGPDPSAEEAVRALGAVAAWAARPPVDPDDVAGLRVPPGGRAAAPPQASAPTDGAVVPDASAPPPPGRHDGEPAAAGGPPAAGPVVDARPAARFAPPSHPFPGDVVRRPGPPPDPSPWWEEPAVRAAPTTGWGPPLPLPAPRPAPVGSDTPDQSRPGGGPPPVDAAAPAPATAGDEARAPSPAPERVEPEPVEPEQDSRRLRRRRRRPAGRTDQP